MGCEMGSYFTAGAYLAVAVCATRDLGGCLSLIGSGEFTSPYGGVKPPLRQTDQLPRFRIPLTSSRYGVIATPTNGMPHAEVLTFCPSQVLARFTSYTSHYKRYYWRQ